MRTGGLADGRTGGRGAVFLDRDGTLVADPGYLHQPGDVRLLPGVIGGLRHLAAAGWPLVVVSNQSGMALGRYGPREFFTVMDRIHHLLAARGVRLLAGYYCPHHPDVTGPCRCRKPGPRLYERAARDFHLDLGRSWYLGDRLADAVPALRFGGHGLLVTPDTVGPDARAARAAGLGVAGSLEVAARAIGAQGS